MKRNEEIEWKVEFHQAEPEIMPIDFQGVHLILTGPLAWFYRLFATMESKERAEKELYPWLVSAKLKYEKAVSVAKQNTAPSL